jgi:hypothetical protein
MLNMIFYLFIKERVAEASSTAAAHDSSKSSNKSSLLSPYFACYLLALLGYMGDLF